MLHEKKKKKMEACARYPFIRYGTDKIHLLDANRVKTLLSGFSDLLSWFLFEHAVRRAAVRTWFAGMFMIVGDGG